MNTANNNVRDRISSQTFYSTEEFPQIPIKLADLAHVVMHSDPLTGHRLCISEMIYF